MSFSADCKTELARVRADRACCREAELRAFTASAASYVLKGRGSVSLVYRVGSIPAAKRIFLLLKSCFNVVAALEYSVTPQFGGRRVCVLRLTEADTRRLMRLPRGPIHTVPARTLNRRCCFWAYLRGVFMASGHMTDPRKNYHLTMAFSGAALAGRCRTLLAERGITASVSGEDLKIDRGDDIASLLSMLGATATMFQFENLMAGREAKRKANRMLNCDRANLIRQSGATVGLISLIQEHGTSELPEDLKAAAQLRLEHPEASVAELASLAEPPVTKSGMYHRLERLRRALKGGEES